MNFSAFPADDCDYPADNRDNTRNNMNDDNGDMWRSMFPAAWLTPLVLIG